MGTGAIRAGRSGWAGAVVVLLAMLAGSVLGTHAIGAVSAVAADAGAGALQKGAAASELPYIHADGFEAILLQITSPVGATFKAGEAGSFAITTSEPAPVAVYGSLPHARRRAIR